MRYVLYGLSLISVTSSDTENIQQSHIIYAYSSVPFDQTTKYKKVQLLNCLCKQQIPLYKKYF
jgi:hypothetical protein